MVAMWCSLKTIGTPPVLPNRRYAKLIPLASTNCVGAVWWECIIILAPLLFFLNRIRCEREGRFRAINVILHRGCAAEPDRPDNFSIHLDGKPATPRGHTRKRGDAG